MCVFDPPRIGMEWSKMGFLKYKKILFHYDIGIYDTFLI